VLTLPAVAQLKELAQMWANWMYHHRRELYNAAAQAAAQTEQGRSAGGKQRAYEPSGTSLYLATLLPRYLAQYAVPTCHGGVHAVREIAQVRAGKRWMHVARNRNTFEWRSI